MMGQPAGSPIDAETLGARWRIATTLARHSRGLDRNDVDLLRSAYAPGAAVAYGMFEGAAHDFAAVLTDAMEGAPVTSHRIAGSHVVVDGGSARSETYVLAYTRTPDAGGGAGMQRMIGGRYLDRHERQGGDWRIAHRTYVMDWNMNVPSSMLPPGPGPVGGQRGADPAHGWFGAETNQERTSGMDAIEEAVAKQALHDLVLAYCRGADRGDAALMASAFHAGAEVVTGTIDGVVPAVTDALVAAVRTNLRSCFHLSSNEYFEVSGDHAVGESYVLAHMLTGGDAPQQILSAGRYLDRFERRGARWGITQRRFVSDWTLTQPATMADDGMYESLTTRGGWAPDDPATGFFAD